MRSLKTPMDVARYCSAMEDRRTFKRRVMIGLSVVYRKFQWSMRPNTGKAMDPTRVI